MGLNWSSSIRFFDNYFRVVDGGWVSGVSINFFGDFIVN